MDSNPSKVSNNSLSTRASSILPVGSQNITHMEDIDYESEGVVPFALAENKVAVEVLQPKLEEISRQHEDKRIFVYGKSAGDDDFKVAMKQFLEHHFKPATPIAAETLFITNGVTVILENFAFALAERGEYIMVTCPYYYRLNVDFFERPGVHILPAPQPLPSESNNYRYALDVDALEKTIAQAKAEGKVVRAIHVNHPCNPTGDMYTRDELIQILDFAHRHDIHVLANELYGLSIIDPEAKFTSILSVPHPDPEKVHFTWGFSKDLGLSGVRISVMYTRNPDLARYFSQTSIYIRPVGVNQARLKRLIEDQDYIDKEALPEIRRRLRARHQSVKEAVEGCGGRVHSSPATVFRWLDLTNFLPSQDWKGEEELFQRFWKGGVHLVAGRNLGHSVPGWFRMVAGIEESPHKEGLKRIVSVLESIKAEKKQQQ